MSQLQIPALLLLLLASACSERSPPHSHNVIAPDFVRDLAEQELDASSPTHEQDFRRYTVAFFLGYIEPEEGSIASTDSTFMAGLRTGQRFRHQDHKAFPDVMAEFGYTAVKASGALSFGMEEMSFIPAADGSDKWWVASLGGLEESTYETCERGTLSGYLSPAGRYGHLGAYGHQVVLREFRCDA